MSETFFKDFSLKMVKFKLLHNSRYFIPSLKMRNHSNIPETGNFTCDELVRWLGTEKHYSNDKKNILFGLLALNHPNCEGYPYLRLEDISYGIFNGKRTFFYNSPKSIDNNNKNQNKEKSALTTYKKCLIEDDVVVVFLSNFSINNNFSHFLHGLLRLFCSLIDSKIFIWDHDKQTFIKTRNYTIWLDENLRLNKEKMIWFRLLSVFIVSLNGCRLLTHRFHTFGKNECNFLSLGDHIARASADSCSIYGND